MLFEGEIDVSPSSSIEYALNAGKYLLLPDLSITSRKKVMSIIVQSRVPFEELDKKTLALTTASATSVVLLRILLEIRHQAYPYYTTFEQGSEAPLSSADAALFIGDHALRLKPTSSHPFLYDLGALWSDFTGLPFVFALWQVNYRKDIEKELAALYAILKSSKSYGLSSLPELADRYADGFGIPAAVLVDYWSSFSYDLGEEEKKGLLAYYGYAARIGVIKAAPKLRFWERQ
jgi:chorismate dehydratase